jgi:NADH-quinone oxidoreductase subunit L
MANYPQLVPLVLFIPLIGFLINIFWGARLGEKWSGIIGSAASLLAFVVALVLHSYLMGSNYQGVVVNPPFFETWIRIPSAGIEIPWQMRVDTLSVTMMLVVTGVGSLIHIYANGYMHGDPRFSRFFAYLNLFLVFMLILVTGNNFLMMFVGWEGVGLCSYLLIGFWFDKAKGEGWKNSNAARKAMIVNRIGDFGLLLGIFGIFWTFGTLDFYKPGEIANVNAGQHGEAAEEHETAAPAEGEAVEAEHEAAPVEGESAEETQVEASTEEGTAAEHEEAAPAEGEHGEAAPVHTNNDHLPTNQLGVFGQFERLMAEGAEVHWGPATLPLSTAIVIITLCMFLGVTGKSAQIPLFVWLPDAMAGPTPVSALIHAATMVTAGVYLMVRSNVFFEAAEFTSLVVAVIGALTAIIAGFIALGQWDIKRVLAYSTISQLGFMVAAVGVGAYGAAMFHLVTHAFFKALLFLGSGSVIHGMEHGHHEVEHGHHDEHADAHHAFDPQDMRTMGGLRSKMPLTYWTYLIGTLALAGIFPLAGFWSKDEILADSWLAGLFENKLGGYIAFVLLLLAAGFTAFYMWRQIELVFHGKARSEAAQHAHESPPVMTLVLAILAFFSIFIGFINTPTGVLGLDNIFGAHLFTTWLEASVVNAHAAEFQPLIAIVALGLGLGAIFVARSIYGSARAEEIYPRDPLQENVGTGTAWSLANARLFWDETYGRLIEQPFNRLSVFLSDTLDWAFLHDYIHNTVIRDGFNAIGNLLSQPVDLGIVDGIVNGVGRLVNSASGLLRRSQTGYVRTYAVAVLLGVVLVIVVLLLPMIQNG